MLLSVTINAKQTRLIRRRRNQETEEFKKKYRKRSGIEATNSGLKRTTGLSRLRVRGKASVFHAMLLKVTGWNIMRAASNPKLLGNPNGATGNPNGATHFLQLFAIFTQNSNWNLAGKHAASCCGCRCGSDRLNSVRANRVESAQVRHGEATSPSVRSIPPFRFAPVGIDCYSFCDQRQTELIHKQEAF